MSDPIIEIANDTDATSLLDPPTEGSSRKSILFFWAEWHPPSNSFDTVVKALTKQNDDNIQFYRVCAEEAPKLSHKHSVSTVPTFLFVNADGTVSDRLDGADDVASLTQCYSKFVRATSSSPVRPESKQQEREETNEQTAQQALHRRLRSLVASSPIMLFQKGTPATPKCGFSRQAVELLTAANVSFGYFNILEDDEVRQGLKSYSDWPTYPQIYVKGELVGGLDIMKELAEEDGGLVKQLELEEFVVKTADVVNDSINGRLEKLINRHRIMLFMKGIPSSPKCGFSRQTVEILDSLNVSYDAFNILEDEEVRQGLKKFSDWPTYPQLYVGGELIGGLDILKEMQENGDLEDLL